MKILWIISFLAACSSQPRPTQSLEQWTSVVQKKIEADYNLYHTCGQKLELNTGSEKKFLAKIQISPSGQILSLIIQPDDVKNQLFYNCFFNSLSQLHFPPYEDSKIREVEQPFTFMRIIHE